MNQFLDMNWSLNLGKITLGRSNVNYLRRTLVILILVRLVFV